MPQKSVKTTLFVSQITAGSGVTVTPTHGTGVVTLAVGGAQTPAAITGSATPFPIKGQAAANATAAGGEIDISGAAGGATSGAGGPAKLTGGAGTAGNSAGGEADVIGGAGQGSAAGGVAKVTGGVGGATGAGGAAQVTGGLGGAGAGGNGGAVPVTGGAAGTGSNGNGGDVNIAGGAKDGTGIGGVVRIGGVAFISQGNQATQDTAATLTAAQLLAGILTSNPAGAINLQLPLATAMDTALPSSVAGDAFYLSVISLAGSTNLPTLTTNTGWTLVGAVTFTAVAGNAGRFLARKTGTGAWTLYRLS
jgi:hypothetical protein